MNIRPDPLHALQALASLPVMVVFMNLLITRLDLHPLWMIPMLAVCASLAAFISNREYLMHGWRQNRIKTGED